MLFMNGASFKNRALISMCGVIFGVVTMHIDVSMAQTSAPLSPGSDLHCIYLPNGKTQVGRATAKGIRKVDFDSEMKKEATSISELRDRIRRMNQTIKRINAKPLAELYKDVLNPKDLKAVNKLIYNGQIESISPSRADLIASLQAFIAQTQEQIEYKKVLITLIKKCRKKEPPSPGQFSIVFKGIMSEPYRPAGDTSGSGYVGVFAEIPYLYVAANRSNFCFQRPANQSGGTIAEYALSNPCYQKTLSDIPAACDGLIKVDEKGKITHVVALLAKLNFSFQERAGGRTFLEAVGAAEAKLRGDPVYGGWGDSVRFAVRKGSVDSCNKAQF